MKNKNPLEVAQNLKKNRYPDAVVAFAAGSVFRGEGSPTSDIDLVVLYDDLFENIGRETIESEGWPIDAFLHNPQSLKYFFNQDRESGTASMMNMIHQGIEVPGPCDLSHQQKVEAKRLLDLGPPPLSDDDIRGKRYFISDLLDDLRGVTKPDERYAILGKLFIDLANFHLRANGQWAGSGKGLVRALRRYDSDTADTYAAAFAQAYESNQNTDLFVLAENILKPHGGALLLYEQKAGPEWRGFKPSEN